jgi:RimJ/RimL family protein N-acetyltransferase
MPKQQNANHTDVVFLRGTRVHLRPPTKDDIPYLLRWMNDEEVIQYLGRFLPVTEADEMEWFDRLQKTKKEQVVFTIVEVKSGSPIGLMGLHDIDWKDRISTTGAVIGEKKFWGKGYGTEAKMLLLNYAFNSLNLRKICSRVTSFNKRSKAYSEKCGYKVEGILKQHMFKKGRHWDLILMAVFKKDWTPLWEAFQKTGRG